MKFRALFLPLIVWYLAVPMSAKTDEIYFTATGQEDGKPLIFRSITSAPKKINKGEFPSLIAISWLYEPNEQGMPDAAINEAQIEFEDALMPLDTNHTGRQMLVVTGNGRKVWYWYVRDAAGWNLQARSLIGQMAYPISVTSTNDDDWSFYERFKAGVEGLEHSP
jgi:hypothetical protein